MIILDEIKKIAQQKPSLDNPKYIQKLIDYALEEFIDSKSRDLTEEAQSAANKAGVSIANYVKILNLIITIKSSNKSMVSIQKAIDAAIKIYQEEQIPAEQLIKDQKITMLTNKFYSIKDELPISSLLLINAGKTILYDESGNEKEEVSKTTFVHKLFESNRPKNEIVYFLKKIMKVKEFYPELINNYLNFDDENGESIQTLLQRQSNTERYNKIADLLITRVTTTQTNVISTVDTHTASIHASVDRSLIKLAHLYLDHDLSKINQSDQKIEITRNKNWLERISDDRDLLKAKILSIISSSSSIEKFVKKTMDNIDLGDQQKITIKIDEFKFKAETALRLIELIESPNTQQQHYNISPQKVLSCGLTLEEILSIAANSLENKSHWKNSDLNEQHFMEFIEHLYRAKRGYNIDDNGEDEWKKQPNLPDKNKCVGGVVNEIIHGLLDHQQVNINIISPLTMRNSLIKALPKILKDLVVNKEDFLKINKWFNDKIIDSKLISLILLKLKQDQEFARPFNEYEITNIGEQVLRQINNQDLDNLKKDLQQKIFDRESFTHQTDIDNFSFNKEKGYILQLEELYHRGDLKKFNELLDNQLKANIAYGIAETPGMKKTNFLFNLLLSSTDKDFSFYVQNIYKEFLKNLNERSKIFQLYNAVENNNDNLLEPLKNANVDLNASDPREHYPTPLSLAVHMRSTSTVKKLLSLGSGFFKIEEIFQKFFYQEYLSYQFNRIEKRTHSQIENKIIKILIENGADINCIFTAHGHSTILQTYGQIKEQLPRDSTDIRAKPIYPHSTILHEYAKSQDKDGNNLNIVQTLLNRGARTDITDLDGYTPVQLALSFRNNLKLIEILIEKENDINKVLASNGRNLLHLAIANGYQEVIPILKNKGINYLAVDKEGNNLLHIAAKYGFTKIFEITKGYRFSINTKNHNNETPLYSSVLAKNKDMVEILIGKKAEIISSDEGGKNSLHAAALKATKDIVMLLIEKGNAEINARDNDGLSILHHAVLGGNLEIVKYLIETTKLDVNIVDDFGRSPLFFASKDKKNDLIDYLIAKEANIEIYENNYLGKNSLHIALSHCNQKIVKLLLSANPKNINTPDTEGKTPLHYAAELHIHRSEKKENGSDKSLVDLLIKANAKVNEQDKNGNTPLHIAAKGHGKIHVIRSLMNNGANGDIVNEDKDTALHISAKFCVQWSTRCFSEVYVEKGFNIELRNKDNKTPIDIVLKKSQLSDVTERNTKFFDDLRKQISEKRKLPTNIEDNNQISKKIKPTPLEEQQASASIHHTSFSFSGIGNINKLIMDYNTLPKGAGFLPSSPLDSLIIMFGINIPPFVLDISLPQINGEAKFDLTWKFKQMFYFQDISKFHAILKSYSLDKSIEALRNPSQFRKILAKFHPDKGGNNLDFTFLKNLQEKLSADLNIEKILEDTIQPLIYKANTAFKIFDIIVDAVRLNYIPTIDNTKKVLIDAAYLYSMYSGVNVISTIINGIDIGYKVHHGEYTQAFTQGLTTAGYMLVPMAITATYGGFAFGAALTVYSAYCAVTNAYSFYQESYEETFSLSSMTAYKNLFVILSYSPLQYIYDLSEKTKEYEIKLNNIKLELEKTNLKERLEERGEFGQKLYEYIYSQMIDEKYDLQNKLAQGILTPEEPEGLKVRHISVLNYDHCMEIIELKEEEESDHYYCYNEQQQILDHIVIIAEAYIEKISSL